MISVIIPIYNASNYLYDCLKSIQLQEFTNFEVLMVDDGSIDNSRDICKKMAEDDSRFHYYYQDNQGVSFARNTGLAVARGEYISFIDADDQIEPSYFTELITAIQTYDFVITGYKVVERDKVVSRVIGPEPKIVDNRELCLNILTNSSVYSFPWNRLYKASILNKYQIKFDPKIRYGEDLVFNLQYCQYVNRAYILATDNYHYIQHDSSASSESLGNVSEQHLPVRMEDLSAMERSLELLPSMYIESRHFLYYRLMKEGSVYYRLMRKYGFSNMECKKIKNKTLDYLHQYIQGDSIQIKVIIKSWINLTFPQIINVIKE